MTPRKNEWIAQALRDRGYTQRHLADAWGSQQATVSRFFQGKELQDLPLSKARALARMLGMTVNELDRRMNPSAEPALPIITQVCAWRDDEYGPFGWGDTAAAAIADLEAREATNV